MGGKMKIDEIAKQSGLSKRTIRYYEEIGILAPPERSKGGTRLYKQEHIDYLNQITISKEVLGFSLQELQQFLSLKEALKSQKEDYRKVTDPIKRKEKLTEMIDILNGQLGIIEEKTRKIHSVQTELLMLKECAQAAVKKIEGEF